MEIIDGLALSKKITFDLKEKIATMKIKPSLIIFQVGDLPSSNKYVASKVKKAREIGIKVKVLKVSFSIDQFKLQKLILKKIKHFSSAIVQLPLPSHIDKQFILDLIPFEKDVDGLAFGNDIFTPATASGVLKLLDYYNFEIKDKKVAVIGKSHLVGQPIAKLLLSRGANLSSYDKSSGISGTENADILIVAAGRPNLVKNENIKQGAIIIDVGINEIGDENSMKKIIGDVDRNSIGQKAKAISPVPGGVGPMTVICLMENVVMSVKSKNH